MSEEEAKTKWCPMVHNLYTGNNGAAAGFNRIPNEEPRDRINNKCISSGCMMWRIRTWYNEERGAQIKGGFCGLAGMP